jgi:predicted ATPase
MKVSIKNFKSIKQLESFEVRPMTILSGVNSSGKSSVIQLLLLFKQGINASSSKYPLALAGDYYTVREYKDVVYQKNLANKIEISFEVDKIEIDKVVPKEKRSLVDIFPSYRVKLTIQLDVFDRDLFIREFLLNYSLPQGEKRDQFLKIIQPNKVADPQLESNTEIFGSGIWGSKGVTFRNVEYIAMFPVSYDVINESTRPGTKEGKVIVEQISQHEVFDVESIKLFLVNYFESISYIGPLRDVPKDEYQAKSNVTSVGTFGENAAQILENFGESLVDTFLPSFAEDVVKYRQTEISLLDALNYWICTVFSLAKNIVAKRIGDTYVIVVENHFGISSTIKHVGFGLSQVIPIILEGLRMPVGGTLILEQPEIHLHPKIQSYLFDFLYGMILSDRNVILETHSDHLITRMRRRIAEAEDQTILEKINLTFVEAGRDNLIFTRIDYDELGTTEYFPPDFIENKNDELKAIVKAQMKKK